MGLIPSLVILALIAHASADVFSCGGFVRSDSQIDFSKITVKLLTTEGNLKHEEEVNPSNGYFMIPVYNKGQYSLRVSSPAGYFFEPDTYTFKLDGQNDPCSKNEDIIFKLNGFSISGVVDGAGAGLNLVLGQNGKEIDSTITKAGGEYELKAPTGKYEVSTAKGASECISRGKSSVEVLSAPVVVTPNLKISGYHLSIETQTLKHNIFSNANIEIFAKEVIDLPNIKCQKSGIIEGVPITHQVLCDLGKTDKNGRLGVACVPTGEYFVKASFGNIEFSPKVQKVLIKQEASKVSFIAESTSSQVRVVVKNQPLSNIDVIFNSKNIGKTDSQGIIRISALKEGTSNTITAKSEHIHFSQVNFQVKFPSVEIDDIKVLKFDVCGTVEKSENGVIEKLSFTRADGKSVQITPTADGTFCQSVSPGKFNVEPSDKTSSLTPRSLTIDVIEKPVTDLRFTHFKTDANVRVTCIGACPTATVSLFLSGNTLVRSVKGTDVFVFENIGPGNYRARLDDNGRGCWENGDELKLIVEQSKVQPTVHFVQSGFSAKLEVSHEAKIKWENVDKKQLRGEASSINGEVLSICVPTAGIYAISLESCYSFEQERFELTVPYDRIHRVKATASRITGRIDLENDKTSAVSVKVRSSSGEREIPVSLADGRFSFDEPLANTGESIHLVPTSTIRLFEPTSSSVRVTGECIENAAEFKSFRGIFIDGAIRPVVQGVEIRAVLNSDESVVITTVSDRNGNYKIGPVKRVEDYTITATLDGFKFTPAAKAGNFESVKLSQLSIKVIDETTKVPLDGVLLSLVSGKGSDYRSNNVLDETASKNFVALAPGEYFVRAILQEYKFSPSTSTIQVKEGQHENVVLKGKRVAFSAYGKIKEMSGVAVPDVIVEALSEGCDRHQSETTTSANGAFRLRGLLPNCKYNIYAKAFVDGTPAPHSFPGQYTVDMTAEDVKSLEYTATAVEQTTDGIVEIDMSSLRDIQSVRVTVHRGQTPIQSISVVYPQTLVYLPHLPRDGNEYSVRVESERPAQVFNAKTAFFTADAPIRVIRIPLTSSRRASEVDISIGSLMSLPFFVFLALAFFNQNRVTEVLQTLYDFATAPNPTGDSAQHNHRKRK